MRELGMKTCGDCRKQFMATTDNEKFCMKCLALDELRYQEMEDRNDEWDDDKGDQF